MRLLYPQVRHAPVAGRGGMDTVPNPMATVVYGVFAKEFVKQRVEGDEDGVVIHCYFAHDGGTLRDQRIAQRKVDRLGELTRLCHEGGAEHQLHIGVDLPYGVEQGAVGALPPFKVERTNGGLTEMLIDIVCTDEDGEHIGAQGNDVFLTPDGQSLQRVATDAPIEELVLLLGIETLEVAGAKHHVTMAVDVVEVPMVALIGGFGTASAIAPPAIGDGVANEKHPQPLSLDGEREGAEEAKYNEKSPCHKLIG